MGLTRIFGKKPIPKVLDFFIVNKFWDHSLRDILEATGVSYRTLQLVVPALVDMGLLKYTRTEGNAKMYVFNKEARLAKELQQLSLEADLRFAEEISAVDEGQKQIAVPA